MVGMVMLCAVAPFQEASKRDKIIQIKVAL